MRQIKKAVGKVLLGLLPYALISMGLVLLIHFGVDAAVYGNLYYRLFTNAPELSAADGVQLNEDYLNTLVSPRPKTDAEKEALRQNNEGDAFTVRSDFPTIDLGEQWATLTIESIDLIDAPVYHGDYNEVLWYGVGHFANSRFPGQKGRVVLSSHVNVGEFAFRKLETMTGGETVVLDTTYGKYVYQVRETVIFDQEDNSYVMPKDGEDTLICYTCYPYLSSSVRTQRFAIICDLVEGEDWTKEAADEVA